MGVLLSSGRTSWSCSSPHRYPCKIWIRTIKEFSLHNHDKLHKDFEIKKKKIGNWWGATYRQMRSAQERPLGNWGPRARGRGRVCSWSSQCPEDPGNWKMREESRNFIAGNPGVDLWLWSNVFGKSYKGFFRKKNENRVSVFYFPWREFWGAHREYEIGHVAVAGDDFKSGDGVGVADDVGDFSGPVLFDPRDIVEAGRGGGGGGHGLF